MPMITCKIGEWYSLLKFSHTEGEQDSRGVLREPHGFTIYHSFHSEKIV